MILHIIKCEMCDSQFNFNPVYRPAERNAPDGWLVLFDAKGMQAQEGHHFCSLACLLEWTIKAERIQKTDHKAYPYCCPDHFYGIPIA